MKRWLKWSLIAGTVCCVCGVGMITAGAMMGGGDRLTVYFRQFRNWGIWNDWHGWNGLRDWEEWHDWERHHGMAPAETAFAYEPAPVEAEPREAVGPSDGPGSSLSPGPEEAEQVISFFGIRRLELNHLSGSAQIIESGQVSADEIRVAQSGDGIGYQPYQEEPDELKIAVPREHASAFWSGQTVELKELLIYVPEGFQFEELDIENQAGAFYAERILAEELSLETASGSIQIDGGSAGEVDVETGSGTVISKASARRSASAECRSGSVELWLAGSQGDYDYEIENQSGHILLNGDMEQIEYTGPMDEIRMDNHRGREVKLECRSGDIRVEYAHQLQEKAAKRKLKTEDEKGAFIYG